jgi:dipeptide/tripeptide permease
MRKLQLQNLSHIVCSSFLFWTLYKQGGVVIQFHIKKFVHIGWANQKAPHETKKQIMHISKVFTFPTYLTT